MAFHRNAVTVLLRADANPEMRAHANDERYMKTRVRVEIAKEITTIAICGRESLNSSVATSPHARANSHSRCPGRRPDSSCQYIGSALLI